MIDVAFLGPILIGFLSQVFSSFAIPFAVLGAASVLAGLCVGAWRAEPESKAATTPSPARIRPKATTRSRP